ncbi:MAG: cupin domain-containing protein [Parcubacteria group bacterium]|nr:cupin domain-containing protein [Parcubacteria group bacterium]
MKIYKKQSKSLRESGNYYFGDYSEIPIGVSFSTIGESNKNKIKDKLHYHKKSNEFYIILEGEGTLEIENKEIALDRNSMIMVEPNEKHKITKVTKTPFRFIAITTEKDKDDKVIVESK